MLLFFTLYVKLSYPRKSPSLFSKLVPARLSKFSVSAHCSYLLIKLGKGLRQCMPPFAVGPCILFDLLFCNNFFVSVNRYKEPGALTFLHFHSLWRYGVRYLLSDFATAGFMMEVATWDGGVSRNIQFVIPPGVSEEAFDCLRSTLPEVFRTTSTRNLTPAHKRQTAE